MRTLQKDKRLAAQISIALMAGMFSIIPSGFAMPVHDANYENNTTDIAEGITTSQDGKTMDIVGSEAHNVIGWTGFSIASDETVRFDGGKRNKDYLNIVTGASTSNILGHMIGGNNVYLVNPYGIILGENAEINVGNLYLSTRSTEKLDITGYKKNGTSPLNKMENPGSYMVSDVVNLMDNGLASNGTTQRTGSLKADTVTVEGQDIRFLNSNTIALCDLEYAEGATVPAAPPTQATVNLYANGYVHVGNKEGAAPSGDNATVINAYNMSAPSTSLGVNSGADKFQYYKLVRNADALLEMNTDKSASYMLADDIDLSETEFTPIGDSTDSFTGNFDGMFHTISNMQASNTSGKAGLFADASGGTLENVGFVNAIVSGTDGAGALAGSVTDETIRNVYSIDGTITASTKGKYAGGLVGIAYGTNTINSSYVKGGSSYGGSIGTVSSGTTTVHDSYTDGVMRDSTNQANAINASIGNGAQVNIYDSYTTASKIGANLNADQHNVVRATSTALSDYSAWDISNTASVEKNADGTLTRHTWRIYEGKSLPLLTAFFKGTVAADYKYDLTGYAENASFKSRESTGGKYSNHMNQLERTYDGGTVSLGTVSLYGADSAYTNYTVDTSNTIKNAGTYYIVSSTDQQGYDIAGGNIVVNKRKVYADVSAETVGQKVYDGTSGINASGDALKSTFAAAEGDVGILSEEADGITMGGTAKEVYYIAQRDEDGNVIRDSEGKVQTVEKAKDVGEGYYVEYDYSGLTLADKAGFDYKKNYDDSNLASASISGNNGVDKDGNPIDPNGKITPAKLTVSLKDVSSEDTYADAFQKVYDKNDNLKNGTEPGKYVTFSGAVAQRNADGTIKKDESENILYEDVTLNVSEASGSYDGVNAGKQDIKIDGIKLADGETYKASNYVLVDSAGTVIHNPSILTVDEKDPGAVDTAVFADAGTITPRAIYDAAGSSTLNVTIRNGETVVAHAEKVYNGTSAVPDGYTFEAENNLPSATTDGDKVYGIVEGDTVGFTVNSAVFADSSGAETKNATGYNGIGTGANRLLYNVSATGADAANYKFNTDSEDTEVLTENTYSIQGSDGSGVINRRELTLEVNPSLGTITKIYDGNDAATIPDGAWAYAAGSKELVGTDNASISVSNGEYGISSYGEIAAKDVARDSAGNVKEKPVSFTVTLTDTGNGDAGNYVLKNGDTEDSSMTLEGATGIINPMAVTAKMGDVTKVYDKTTAVSDDQAASALSGVTFTNVSGENTYDPNQDQIALTALLNYSGSYASYNVADNDGEKNTVSYRGVALAETDNAGNYTLVNPSNIAEAATETTEFKGDGTITPRLLDQSQLQVNDTGTHSKIYDATNVYNSTGTIAVTIGEKKQPGDSTGKGLIDGDSMSFNVHDAYFVDSNGSGTTDATKSGLTTAAEDIAYNVSASGDSIGNYTVDTTNATPLTTEQLFPLMGQYDFKNADGNTGILKREITLNNSSAVLDKVYDGSNTVKQALTYGSGGVTDYASGSAKLVKEDTSNDDGVTLSLTGTYAGKDVAYDANDAVTSQAVTIYAALAGDKAANYDLKTPAITGATGTISRRQVTASFDDANKVYDGTVTVTSVPKGTVDEQSGDTGVVSGEDLTAKAVSGDYSSKNAGTYTATDSDKRVTYTDVSLVAGANTNVKNYELTNPTAYGGGTITPKPLTATFTTAVKTYDGTKVVPTTTEGDHTKPEFNNFEGLIDGDVVELVYTVGEYESADANYKKDGTTQLEGKTNKVSYTGLSLSGADSANYSIESTATGDGIIKQRTLHAEDLQIGAGAVSKYYDNTSSVAYSYTDLSGSTTTKAAKDFIAEGSTIKLKDLAGNDKTVTFDEAGLAFSVNDGKYYKSGTTEFDETNEMSDAGTGIARFEVQVDKSNIDSNGNFDASELTNVTEVIKPEATINKRPVYATVENNVKIEKVYDGNAQVKQEQTEYAQNLVLHGLVGYDGEAGHIGMKTGTNGVTAAYSDKDVAYDGNNVTTKTVTYSNLALDGDKSGNYLLQTSPTDSAAPGSLTGEGIINPRTVYVDFVEGKDTGIDKTYDTTAAASTTYTENNTTKNRIALVAADTEKATGIISNETDKISLGDYQGYYVKQDGTADANVSRNTDGTAGTKNVYYNGFTLATTDSSAAPTSNYVIRTADDNTKGISVENAGVTLVGEGTINPRTLQVTGDAIVAREYDGTKDVYSLDENGNKLNNALSTLSWSGNGVTAGSPDLEKQEVTLTVSGTALGGNAFQENVTVSTDAYAQYESADSNVKNGLEVGKMPVHYSLNLGSQNYDLQVTNGTIDESSIQQDSANSKYKVTTTNGTITPRTLVLNQAEKDYDGNSSVQMDAATLFQNVVDKDKDSLVISGSGTYYSGDQATAQASDSVTDDRSKRTVKYTGLTVNDANYQIGNGTTYQYLDTDENGNEITKDGNVADGIAGTGYINRATLTATADQQRVPTGTDTTSLSYSGSVTGWVNEADQQYPFVWHPEGEVSTDAAGKYAVYGWYRNEGSSADGITGNYGLNYKVVQAGSNGGALEVYTPSPFPFPIPDPLNPGGGSSGGGTSPIEEVKQGVTVDSKVKPNATVYEQVSGDPDAKRMDVSTDAEVKYNNGGVNYGVNVEGQAGIVNLSADGRETDEISLVDLESTDGTVNLEDETGKASESTISITTTENAVNTGETELTGSTAEISVEENGTNLGEVTTMEENTENKNAGYYSPGISILTQDEDDEEDEEEENLGNRLQQGVKSANIGLETLGDAVNLGKAV